MEPPDVSCTGGGQGIRPTQYLCLLGSSRMMWLAKWERGRLNWDLGNLVSTQDSTTTNSRPRLRMCQTRMLLIPPSELFPSSESPSVFLPHGPNLAQMECMPVITQVQYLKQDSSRSAIMRYTVYLGILILPPEVAFLTKYSPEQAHVRIVWG